MPQASVIELVRPHRSRPRVHHDAEGRGRRSASARSASRCRRWRSRSSTPTPTTLRAPDEVGELLVRLPGKRREYYKDDGANATHVDRRRLAAHRRPRVPRRRRLRLHLGPHQGHDHPRRQQHLRHRRRSGAPRAPRRAGSRGHRRAAPRARRGRRRVRRVQARRRRSTTTTLLAFCAERLADYKRPRRLWFVDELPRNATGKVMKHKLREQVGP